MPPLTIGIVFETFDTYARRAGDPEDYDAEYEPEATVELLEAAIALLGHRAVRIGSPHALLETSCRGSLQDMDVALSIAEGRGSRNREAWAPVLLEMLEIPTLGSDALTLSLSLDKAWTNQRVACAGVSVADQCVMGSASEARSAALPCAFPLFVKPRWEGTSKGIHASSRVEDRAALVREVVRIARDYHQPALVERFLAGAEYTVTVVGNAPPRALAVLQRALEIETRIGLHALEGAGERSGSGVGNDLRRRQHCAPGHLDTSLEQKLQELALRVYAVLECRDFARADFRLDEDDEPVFLEINPLPTFAPDGTFGILAELEGRPVAELVGDVLRGGLRRLGLA